MIALAAVHPAGARLAMTLLGLIGFAAVVSSRRASGVPAGSLIALTVLATAWLFGATLIWGTPYASKIRWESAWVHDPTAWQWTALLVIAYVGSLSAAAALRFFAEGRHRLGWWFAGVALVMFIAWSAPVRYPVALAALLAGAALTTIAAAGPGVLGDAATPTTPPTSSPEDALNAQPPPGLSDAEPLPVTARHAKSRIPVIVGATLLTLAWIGVALLWFAFRQGENVQCNCWADNQRAWQYGGQVIAALIGVTSLGLMARSYLRDHQRSLLVAVPLTTLAVGAWILFLATGT